MSKGLKGSGVERGSRLIRESRGSRVAVVEQETLSIEAAIVEHKCLPLLDTQVAKTVT